MFTNVIITRLRAVEPRILVAERQRGFVAMVAVGNQQLLVGHPCLQSLQARRVGDAPQPVRRAVLVRDRGHGHTLRCLVQQRVHRGSPGPDTA